MAHTYLEQSTYMVSDIALKRLLIRVTGHSERNAEERQTTAQNGIAAAKAAVTTAPTLYNSLLRDD